MNNISFIFGMGRSGTTWLWNLIESHNKTKPFVKFNKLVNGKYKSSESGVYVKNTNLAKGKISKFCKLNENYLIFEKTPEHIKYFKRILKDFPNSKNILIVRHPLAILNSMLNSNMNYFNKFNLKTAINEIKTQTIHLKNINKHKNTYTISYEDLNTNTKSVLLGVFNFLKLDTNKLDEIIKINEKASKVNVKHSFRVGSNDSYLKELKEQEIKLAKKLLEKEIQEYENNWYNKDKK